MADNNFKEIGDIVAFAVKREEEAARSYGDMAAKAKTESQRLLLNDLMAEEENHKRLLSGLSPVQIASLRAVRVQDLKISDYLVEAPFGADMSFQDLLIFAAKKEQKAVELYTRLLGMATAPEQKKLFEFLISQEKSHKLKLETEYEKRVMEED